MSPSDVVFVYTQEKTNLKENAARMDIDALVTAYYGTMRRLAFSILEDAQEAEDASQETFIAACLALHGSPGGW
jgi:DNA-directed RNA polymerase specialized sigma24 family protein